MFYISNKKADLDAYNILVAEAEKYDGVSTQKWATVHEHKDGGLFAILANLKYEADLETVENLDGWFKDFLI